MELDSLRVIIAGGGTGGHLFPALAIADEIQRQRPDAAITFIGTEKGIESRIVPSRGYPLELINVAPFYRKRPLANLTFPWKLMSAFTKCLSLMKRHRPHLVIGTGGYVSGPVLMAAAFRGIPRAIQEQNALPGSTTRLLAPRVHQIHLGFDEARKTLKTKGEIHNHGNPVAPADQDPSRQDIIEKWNLHPELPTVLITGGSQGARSINQAVQGILVELLSVANVIWQTGKQPELLEVTLPNDTEGRTRMQEFFDPMNEAYAVADLAVSRSGALTLAELTLRGIPSILIPYPFAAGGHQEWNAKAMVDAGGAVMILDKELDSTSLLRAVREIITNSEKRSSMSAAMKSMAKPDALQRIVADLFRLIS